MKRTEVRLSLPTLGAIVAFAAFALAAPLLAVPASPQEPPEKQDKALQPFHGNVDAVDTAAKTMTVGGRVIYITETSKLLKLGKVITLSEIMTGDTVHGTSQQTFDGKTQALTVIVGPKAKDAPGETPQKP